MQFEKVLYACKSPRSWQVHCMLNLALVVLEHGNADALPEAGRSLSHCYYAVGHRIGYECQVCFRFEALDDLTFMTARKCIDHTY